MKRAFGLITAIFIMTAVAGLGALLLSFASTRAKRTSDDFQRLQAEILAVSAEEYAVMRIGAFDRSSGNCLEKITIDAAPYAITVDIHYFLSQQLYDALSTCNTRLPIITDESADGTVILDINVTRALANQETIRVFKRSVQRP